MGTESERVTGTGGGTGSSNGVRIREENEMWSVGQREGKGEKEGVIKGEIKCNNLGNIKGMCNQGDSQKSDKRVNPYKAIVDMNKGGYNSYFKNKALLGDISDILNYNLREDIEAKFKENVLALLEVGKSYSVLLQVSYISDGQIKGASPMKSIVITKQINTFLVIQRFKMALNKFESEYQLSDYYGKCFVCWREWLSKEDYLKGISETEVDNIVNEVLLEEMPMSYSDYIKKRGIGKFIDVSKFDKIISVLPNYESIDKLHSIGKVGPIGEVGVIEESESIEVDTGKMITGLRGGDVGAGVIEIVGVQGVVGYAGVQGVQGVVAYGGVQGLHVGKA
jgi:hypothetical protein